VIEPTGRDAQVSEPRDRGVAWTEERGSLRPSDEAWPSQRGVPPSVKGKGRRVGSEGARNERRERGGKTAGPAPRRRAENTAPEASERGYRANTLRDIGLLFQRYVIQLLRNPVWLIVGFSTPILYLVLFMPLLKHAAGPAGLSSGQVVDLFLPGILSLLAFASGIGLGFNTIFELKAGVIERFRVTPASRLAILTGPILATMMMMFVFDAVVVAVGFGVGFSVHWAGLAVLAVLLALLMTTVAAFSVATALITKDISGFAAIVNGLNLPVLLLAGVLLPISLGPAWMRVIAHFNPLYYLVEASRVLAGGTLAAAAVGQAFAVLVPLCLLVLAWATGVFRKAVA
jgi:ABC-2 type transport system permease protein